LAAHTDESADAPDVVADQIQVEPTATLDSSYESASVALTTHPVQEE